MKKIILASAAVAAMSMGLSTSASAACGTKDATNNVCTTAISATIDKKIIIKNLGALAMGTYDGTNPLTANDDFCIGTNSKDGATVAYTSLNASGAAIVSGGTGNLKNTNGNTVQYTLTVVESAQSLGCSTDDSNIKVDVTAAAADGATVDGTAFTETITITASPT